ncbi:MAG: hypothetical protein Q8J62_04785, partial [Candidatus Cloacimonadaceae bacterium]|nr:hypothetical protein [Candidatus Cloacimonadaceae bacterium]
MTLTAVFGKPISHVAQHADAAETMIAFVNRICRRIGILRYKKYEVIMRICSLLAILMVLAFPLPALDAPSGTFTIEDVPWDNGMKLLLKWNLSAGFDSLQILTPDSLGVFQSIQIDNRSTGDQIMANLEPNQDYTYRLEAYNRSTGERYALQATGKPL